MSLNYLNPNDWGRSPLTDRALRLQEIKAENLEQWAAMIQEDIETLSMPIKEESTEFKSEISKYYLCEADNADQGINKVTPYNTSAEVLDAANKSKAKVHFVSTVNPLADEAED